jgi:aminopeptidase N
MNIMETMDRLKTDFPPNYAPSLPFTIENMWLRIEPDFVAKKIIGQEQLKLLAKQNISDIQLDIGQGVEIKSVIFSTGADFDTPYDKKELHPQIQNGKLIIPLEYKLSEGTRFYLVIRYTAEGSEPGRGFHFVSGSAAFPTHAWTLTEPNYSRNWFPCLDHPQVKFPREVSFVVPQEYMVLSNGELDITDQEIQTEDGVKKRKVVWEELNPNPAYLTSVVIGKFVETSGGQNYNGIPLRYYVPQGREADAQRTFKNTANMMKIFEEYFNMKYPYNKYSQIVVKGLVDGQADGMEHTTCTTLDIDEVLAESTTPEDRIKDDVIAHELAHQWFGDLVTCRDWQDIWLNEGFAAFCEALYFEKSKGNEEYQRYITQMTKDYIALTKDPRPKTPIRAIVTNKYEHPDDLFDHNTYKKGGIVLHMLRKYLGEEDFRKSLYVYLERFKHKTAETDDLRQILEEVSGINLQQFFEQWIYREGHPKLNVQISDDQGKVKLILTQQQEGDAFIFPLEIQFVLLSNTHNKNGQNETIEQVHISEKTFSKSFDIPTDKLDHVAIDPEYKILKEYVSVDIPHNFVVNQLQNGKTIFKRLEAAHFLKEISPSSKLVLENMKMTLSKDSQWPVSVEAMNALNSSLQRDNNSDEQDYEYLKKTLEETSDPKIRRVVIDSMANFRKIDSFDLLKKIVQNDNADPYERYSAAIAISNTGHEESLALLKALTDTTSYHNLVARGAIEGLKIIAIDSKDKRIKEDVESFVIKKAKDSTESRLKRNTTSALGYLGRYAENKTKIIEQLKEQLYDESFYIRNTACVAIANALEGTNDSNAIEELRKIAKEDSNSIVRATAIACINIIKGEEAKAKEKEKGRFGILEEQTKIDSKYKSEKFDLLERVVIYS